MMHYPGKPRGGAFESGGTRSRALTNAPVDVSDTLQSASIQFLVVATLTLATLAAGFMPADVLLPSIAVAALAVATLAGLVAWQWTITRGPGRLTLWDISGLFAFIGFGACMLSDPHAVVQFFASGDVQSAGRRQ